MRRKRRTKNRKRIQLAGVLFLTLSMMAVSLCPAGVVSAETETETVTRMPLSHGTADKDITEDMLNNTPPDDYQVDMSIQGDAKDGAYDDYFLKDDVQTVSIKIDENNLNYLLQNADEKPTVMTESVTIGDKTVGYTGLKTKGSYTLQHSYTDNYDSDRFSFTVNFGKYIKKDKYGVKQNFFGCHKISFNNFYFDKTMMKEYIALTLMTEMGLPTPQYGLAKLYINDNFYGVYFMVESMDQSILEQYQQVDGKEVSDYLTKPENTSLLYDEAMDKLLTSDGTFDLSSVLKQDENGVYKASGVLKDQDTLWEQDEDTLQDVAETLPTVFSWQKKINQLSSGTNFSGETLDVNSDEYLELLNQVMDVDEVVRYFAVHSFLVQIDDMFDGQKNYGLYVDNDGKCMVIPWDYDLSFGCYFPSTAEATANFDIDAMYKKGQVGFGAAAEKSPEETYSQFPLFYVIYQNTSLMEQYHKYMKECSKIAALGGTTFTGKSYEPGWFHSLIEQLEEPLTEAASEKLAANVNYMNFINQPSGVKLGLPNLSKIIAMRSVGVLAQVDGLDTTVCGYGCNLETLGNAAVGENSNRGVLTAVDDTTGIYVTADYGITNQGQKSPSLSVRTLGQKEDVYKTIKKSIGCSNSDLIVYNITNTSTPSGEYTVNVPLSINFAKSGAELYAYTTDGGVKKLDAAADDNVYTAVTDTIQYIVVAKKGNVFVRIWTNPVLYIVLGVAVLLVLAVVIVRKKAGKGSKK